jgi:hypothetical protein
VPSGLSCSATIKCQLLHGRSRSPPGVPFKEKGSLTALFSSPPVPKAYSHDPDSFVPLHVLPPGPVQGGKLKTGMESKRGS